MLYERLTRKEELLRDYEKDLGRLRQAEILLREKETLIQDLEVGICFFQRERTCSPSLDGQTVER